MSRRVDDTSTSLPSASAATRAAMCTAMPATSILVVPRTSTSPAWIPARTSRSSTATAATTASAQAIAALGLVNVATKPSPAVFTSSPPNRWIS